MSKAFVKFKNLKIFNKGILKKIKDKIYYNYISPKEEKRTDKYRTEIIGKIYDICKGKKWMLSSGALLRHYRDDTMEGQDLDIDILDTDFDKIKEKFIENGFKIKQVFINPNGKITEYKFIYKNVEIDVFLLNKNGKNHDQFFTIEKNNAKEIDKKIVGNKLIVTGDDYISYLRKIHEFKDVIDYEYEGVKYCAPKNIEGHIVELYGDNWKVYDPNFDPKTNPKNNKPIPYKGAKSIVYIEPIDYYEDVKNMI